MSIEYKEPGDWDDREANRLLGKTYEESVKGLLCQIARFEVADQIITAVKNLPNTPHQKEASDRIERELQEYWKKNPDVGYQSPLDGTGMAYGGR